MLCSAVAMVMFTTFEHSVELMYQDILQKRREDCSKAQQLAVSCVAGYAAGAVGTVVSNPADNIVSSLYNKKAATVMQVIVTIIKSLFCFSTFELSLMVLLSGRKEDWTKEFVNQKSPCSNCNRGPCSYFAMVFLRQHQGFQWTVSVAFTSFTLCVANSTHLLTP